MYILYIIIYIYPVPKPQQLALQTKTWLLLACAVVATFKHSPRDDIRRHRNWIWLWLGQLHDDHNKGG